MTADLIGTVSHCGHLDLAAQLTAAGQRVDALIVDAPYSERTHSGHDDGTVSANSAAARIKRPGKSATFECRASKLTRRPITYASWSAHDVHSFVGAWAPVTSGWIVSITDHVLAPEWARALEDAGRYVFAPIAFVAPGSRVRLGGDGPAQWGVWIIVSRPKSRVFASWGSLPGAYVLPAGESGSTPVVGGKPLWLMRALVRDYSRPGDLVCDPCAGAGTTLLAAKLEGRWWIGGDIDENHISIARDRLADTPIEDRKGTLPLFAPKTCAAVATENDVPGTPLFQGALPP